MPWTTLIFSKKKKNSYGLDHVPVLTTNACIPFRDIHKNLLSNVPTLKLMGDVRLPRFLHEKLNLQNNNHADAELHQPRYNSTGSGTQSEYVYA